MMIEILPGEYYNTDKIVRCTLLDFFTEVGNKHKYLVSINTVDGKERRLISYNCKDDAIEFQKTLIESINHEEDFVSYRLNYFIKKQKGEP